MFTIQNRCKSLIVLEDLPDSGLQFPMDDVSSLIESSDFSQYFYNTKKYCHQDESTALTNYMLVTEFPLSPESYLSALSKGDFDISLKIKNNSEDSLVDIHLDEINTKIYSSDACFKLIEKETVLDLVVRKYKVTPNDVWKNSRALLHIEITVSDDEINDPVFLALMVEICTSMREDLVKKQNITIHLEGKNIDPFAQKLFLTLLLKNPTIEKTAELAQSLNLFTPETFETNCKLICDFLNENPEEYRCN